MVFGKSPGLPRQDFQGFYLKYWRLFQIFSGMGAGALSRLYQREAHKMENSGILGYRIRIAV